MDHASFFRQRHRDHQHAERERGVRDVERLDEA
jgi:hypothetical protein